MWMMRDYRDSGHVAAFINARYKVCIGTVIGNRIKAAIKIV